MFVSTFNAEWRTSHLVEYDLNSACRGKLSNPCHKLGDSTNIISALELGVSDPSSIGNITMEEADQLPSCLSEARFSWVGREGSELCRSFVGFPLPHSWLVHCLVRCRAEFH